VEQGLVSWMDRHLDPLGGDDSSCHQAISSGTRQSMRSNSKTVGRCKLIRLAYSTAGDRAANARLITVIPPTALLAFGIALAWIFRGFRRTPARCQRRYPASSTRNLGAGLRSRGLTPPIKVSSPPLQPGGFFFCSCQAQRSAGSPSPAAGFEVRPIPSAGKIERPIAVRTVFERPGG
jgi:hypothetical protein